MQIIRANSSYIGQIKDIVNEELDKALKDIFIDPKYGVTNSSLVKKFVENGNYFVALEGNRVIGAMSLLVHEPFYEIKVLAIDQEFQRQGRGTVFIKYAEGAALSDDKSSLFVIAATTLNVKDFYEINAFVLKGMYEHWTCNDPGYAFEKRLK